MSKETKRHYVLECLQCGEVFMNENSVNHKCMKLNEKLTGVLDLGTVEQIGDSTITGVSRIIGIIDTPIE